VAPPFVPPSPIGNAQKSLSQERDRWFEPAASPSELRTRATFARVGGYGAEPHLYGDRDPVLETSKLPNSAGDRWFESISLLQRVCEPSVPRWEKVVFRRAAAYKAIFKTEHPPDEKGCPCEPPPRCLVRDRRSQFQSQVNARQDAAGTVAQRDAVVIAVLEQLARPLGRC
jgi:hypothetical protein